MPWSGTPRARPTSMTILALARVSSSSGMVTDATVTTGVGRRTTSDWPGRMTVEPPSPLFASSSATVTP